MLLAIAGIIWQGGVLSGKVTSNTQRIERIESSNQRMWDKLNEMNARGERNAGKLDYLVERASEDKRSH